MNEIWEILQRQLSLDLQNSGLLKIIFSELKFLSLTTTEQTAVLNLETTNAFSTGIAKSQLQELIHRKLADVTQARDIQIRFQESTVEAPVTPCFAELEECENLEVRAPQVVFRTQSTLKSDFTLENFVNGSHSEFAVRCVELMSSTWPGPYRQFFLHGGSGFGKTHLLHALGWKIRSFNPALHVKVFTADEFINDYHMYVSKKQMAEFRGKYRLKTDVLLLDDIHQMSRAKGAQEELFNTFNYYEQTGKLIAFTSDKSPHELENFEPRLLTRFQGGLSCELQNPDFAARVEILTAKCRQFNFNLQEPTLKHIATAVHNSVRSLEGALFKVGTYQQMKGALISIDELNKLLPAVVEDEEVTVENILSEVARAAGLKVNDLKSVSRKRIIVNARDQAMSRIRESLNLSYAEIGRIFGRDHSSVMAGIRRVER